jgi:hypothetical protein
MEAGELPGGSPLTFRFPEVGSRFSVRGFSGTVIKAPLVEPGAEVGVTGLALSVSFPGIGLDGPVHRLGDFLGAFLKAVGGPDFEGCTLADPDGIWSHLPEGFKAWGVFSVLRPSFSGWCDGLGRTRESRFRFRFRIRIRMRHTLRLF